MDPVDNTTSTDTRTTTQPPEALESGLLENKTDTGLDAPLLSNDGLTIPSPDVHPNDILSVESGFDAGMSDSKEEDHFGSLSSISTMSEASTFVLEPDASYFRAKFAHEARSEDELTIKEVIPSQLAVTRPFGGLL